jgi:NAD(P)-dependent dehydrogenase (short-subunit alcohol dehydrogenase family)
MVDAAVRRFGALDVLFSNAGVEFVGDIEATPEDRWDLVLDTNLKSMYQMARFAVPEMRRRGKGVIINNASQLAFAGAAKFSAYCASKGGVVSLTRALALELAPFNIRVNALCPGAVETPLLMRQFSDGRGPQGSLDDLIRMHALGRLAQPIELAYPALFLASDESSFMTGSALIVDGGYLAG